MIVVTFENGEQYSFTSTAAYESWTRSKGYEHPVSVQEE